MLQVSNLDAGIDDDRVLRPRRLEGRALYSRLPASVLILAFASACGNASPQGYKALPLPTETFAVPQDIFSSALRQFPEGREGRQEMELSLRKAGDGSYVVLLTRTGFLDDSVEGEQRRAVLRYERRGWRAVELGERWRCYAGRGPASWTTKPCN